MDYSEKNKELKECSQVKKILEKNSVWIESLGKEGKRANLSNRDMSNHFFFDTSFRGAILDGSTFDGSNCMYSIFIGAKLRRARFKSCNLYKTIYDGCKVEQSIFSCSKMVGVRMTKCRINAASFSQSNLTRAVITNSTITSTRFFDAKLRNANFSDSVITNCIFDNASLQETNFERARLNGSSFLGSKLNNANLRFANLSNTNLCKAILIDADITGANLYQITSEGWNIRNINCDYVYFDLESKERVPADRDFEKGEFEELYAHHPTFTYYLKSRINALDPYFISVIVTTLNTKFPDLKLRIEEIHGSSIKPKIIFSASQSHDIKEVGDVLSSLLDNKLSEISGNMNTEIREIASLLERKLTSEIYSILKDSLEDVKMTKIEFNAPVQNVITGNSGTINIQTLSDQQILLILEGLNKLKPQNEASKIIREEAIKEITKIATGDLKSLSPHVFDWIRNTCTELNSDILAIIERITN